MALNINTNIGALGAAAAASSVNKSMETSMERLASGLRINTAADDAAGVAIASRLTSEIRGTNMAIRNAMDGQAMIDTAEGAHNEIVNILQRMRELAVQAANDTNDANDRGNLQLEIDQLTTEINRIADVTTWAGQSLLNGTGGTAANGVFTFQVGTGTASQNQISATINSMTAAALGVGEGNIAVSANATTLTEIGNNVLQVGGVPLENDVYSFTVGGTDMKVKLGAVDTAATTFAKTDPTTGTLTIASNVVTVAGTTTAGQDMTVTMNGIDFVAQTGTTAEESASNLAAAINAAGYEGVSATVDGDDVTITAASTLYSYSTDGGLTYSAAPTADARALGTGVTAAADAITRSINAKTSTDYLGLTATSAADGSVTFTQAVSFSAASVASGATGTLDTTAVDVALAMTATNLTGFSYAAGGNITGLATALEATDEIESATVNGTNIDIVFKGNSATTAGYNFVLTDSAADSTTALTVTAGIDDTSLASTSADGTQLTLTPFAYENGNDLTFTINGEAFTVALDATDKYDANQAGLIEKITDVLAASTKHGGVAFTVAASTVVGETDNIIITAAANTTTLLEDPVSTPTASTNSLNVGTAATSRSAITAIDAAINTVNTQRADLGAISNRLDSTVANLTNISTNLEAGRSRIQDADFAAESTNLAKAQILQQASMAMLAQANASKQGVLSLLQG